MSSTQWFIVTVLAIIGITVFLCTIVAAIGENSRRKMELTRFRNDRE